jgi:DnaJ homolog subfamily C member 28
MSKVDEHIQKAMAEGQFDNLPGKGKPLKLEDETHVDPEWRLAQHMLKSGGFTLPWIELRQQIEKELAEQRAALRRSWEWRQEAVARDGISTLIENEWQQAVKMFRERITALNQRIRDYNLQAPSDRFHLLVVNTDKELEALASEKEQAQRGDTETR